MSVRNRATRIVWSLVFAALSAPFGARGDDAAPADPPLDPNRWEPGALPALAYDSDVGFGFGAVGTLARFEEGYNPYRFRGELQLFVSIRRDESGRFQVPQQDHYFKTDLPGLWGNRLRLSARLGFREYSNMGYYGLGAASERVEFAADELEQSEVARRFHQYKRRYPHAEIAGRINLLELPASRGKRRLELLLGATGGYNWLTLYPGSNLERDVALRDGDGADQAAMRGLLFGTDDHGSLALSTGLLWDSRDHEAAPTRGSFTELSMQVSPGVDDGLGYGRFYFGTSWYAPLVPEHLVVATRGLVDWLEGRPAVYELARFGVLSPGDGPGGSGSVRGVLRHRYHGKIKTIGNLELRGQFPWFSIAGERFRIGLVTFVDAGRVWVDATPVEIGGRALDGPFEPFDVGTGGGARIQWGETFVLRIDGAYSPTDGTTGFYVDLGHVF